MSLELAGEQSCEMVTFLLMLGGVKISLELAGEQSCETGLSRDSGVDGSAGMSSFMACSGSVVLQSEGGSVE